MKEKTKVEISFIESLIETAIEAIKNLLNIETDENGNLKSFKLIRQGNKGIVYEFEVRTVSANEKKEKSKGTK